MPQNTHAHYNALHVYKYDWTVFHFICEQGTRTGPRNFIGFCQFLHFGECWFVMLKNFLNAAFGSGVMCSQNLNLCSFEPFTLVSAFFACTKAGAPPRAPPTKTSPLTYHGGVCAFTFFFIAVHHTAAHLFWCAGPPKRPLGPMCFRCGAGGTAHRFFVR